MLDPQPRPPWRAAPPDLGDRYAARFLASARVRRRAIAAALGLAEHAVGGSVVTGYRARFGRTTVMLEAEVAGRPRGLVAKLDPNGGGARALHTIRALRRAGLAPPAPATVPEALGFLAAERLLLLELVAGRSWRDEILAGRAAAASERAAEWLLAFQRLELPLGRLRRRSAPAVDPCGALAASVPELAADLRRWRARLAPLAELGTGTSDGRPSHGDFHPKNLLLAPGRTTAVDLDEIALGDPAADVGGAVAQLLAMAWFDLGDAGAGAGAAGVFWERWAREARGRGLEERATLHALAALLGVLHYSYALASPHRDLAHRWLPALEAWWTVRRRGLPAGVAHFAEVA